MKWILATCALVFLSNTSEAQGSPSARSLPIGPDIDSLLHALEASWQMTMSPHFRLYTERHRANDSTAQLLRQLEEAWRHDVSLIGVPTSDGPRVNVVVTSSRTMFPSVMSPQNKGVAGTTRNGTEFVFLVRNDSVRAYTRHEVMHVITRRAWGTPVNGAYWLVEGFATYADGECQGTTIAAVARDILAASPDLTISDVTERFNESAHADRARAYVLAGLLAAFQWETLGESRVKALWQGRDNLSYRPEELLARATETSLWRKYVTRTAERTPGISPGRLRRFGCG